jgi:hypothetical protein
MAKSFPAKLGGLGRSDVNAPGVGVWGKGEVVLRCGLRPPLASTNPCVNVNGVDWLVESADPQTNGKTIITFGRRPAVEVSLSDRTPEVDATLVDLSRLVKPIHQQDRCS